MSLTNTTSVYHCHVPGYFHLDEERTCVQCNRQFIFGDSDCDNQIQAVMRVSIAEAFHPTLEIPVILIVTE